MTNEAEVKKMVRDNYGQIAKQGDSCCAPNSSCCGNNAMATLVSRNIGYSDADIKAAPEGANLGLGCGNPVALASLKKGEVVLDLGSGAGFDCFLAAQRVGAKGRVIGVDMTAEMIDRARENARKGKYANVEFRLGEIENLPVADNYVDAIISNCVINLSPDKKRVFQEAHRVLKPGGRLMVADIVLLQELPDFLRDSVAAYVSCIAGAMQKDDYLKTLKAAGFKEVSVIEETTFPIDMIISDPMAQDIMKKMKISRQTAADFARAVVSVKVSAMKAG